MGYDLMDILGFGKGDDGPKPNRAQRRALERKLKRQQRKGQRAWERQQRNQS
jgi:hypothetical protein